MSARLVAVLIGHDARLQLRNGIYYAYAAVVIFYAVALIYLGPWLPSWAAPMVVYSDPAVLGFFFLGAMMMLEKAEGARSALAMTPISAGAYLWSKLITLTCVAVIAVCVIGALDNGAKNWPLLLSATVLTSAQFIGIGVPIALRFKAVTSYLIGSTGLLLPVVLPGLLALYEPMPRWAIIIPSTSQLRLFLVSFGANAASAWEITSMLAISAIAAAGCIWWGVNSLQHEFGRK